MKAQFRVLQGTTAPSQWEHSFLTDGPLLLNGLRIEYHPTCKVADLIKFLESEPIPDEEDGEEPPRDGWSITLAVDDCTYIASLLRWIPAVRGWLAQDYSSAFFVKRVES